MVISGRDQDQTQASRGMQAGELLRKFDMALANKFWGFSWQTSAGDEVIRAAEYKGDFSLGSGQSMGGPLYFR